MTPRRSGLFALAAALALGASGCAGDCSYPGAGWLTYISLRSNQFDVRAVNADGTCDVPVAHTRDNELAASFSAGTHAIVYFAWRGGRGRLAFYDVYTGVEHLLDTGSLLVGNPDISADGEWLAFEASDAGAKTDVYVMPARGGARRAVTDDPATDSQPVWSAGGEALYFASDRTGSQQIWKVGADGLGLAQVTSDAAAAITCGAAPCPILGRPAPSPDGQFLAFVRGTPDLSTRVIVQDLTSGAERILADAPDAEPSWAPTSTELAVRNTSFDDAEIIVRDATTGLLLRRLTDRRGIDGAPSFAR